MSSIGDWIFRLLTGSFKWQVRRRQKKTNYWTVRD